MAIVPTRRAAMTLFSQPTDARCHRIRVVIQEKGISNAEIENLGPDDTSEDLLQLNPYNTVPTLVDRELVLYDSAIICEYLDERFPHPPLMPVDPVSRARFRLAMHQIDNEMYQQIETIENGSQREAKKARNALRDNLTSISELFSVQPFFLSDELSLVDCAIMPVLWRLEVLGITLPASADGLVKYAERMFAREGFQASLTELEREMRL